MKFSAFTKPWPHISINELCEKISAWGYDGVEFPLRPGYQVEPENAEKGLPDLAKKLSDYGLSVMSVATSFENTIENTEKIFSGCQAAKIPVIRIMTFSNLKNGYINYEQEYRKFLETLLSYSKRFGVKVALQNHFMSAFFNSMELRFLLDKFDPQYIGACWDAGHSGLSGEIAEKALDIIWDKLITINLKNAYWKQVNGPECEQAIWEPYFTAGRYGMASFPDIITYLKKRGYTGDICLPIEYTDEESVERLAPEELRYVKDLFKN